MTSGPELWLVRHGETTCSAVLRLAGWSDPPLTARGEEEARALRPLLDGHPFAGVWSSDLVRTVTTARLAWGEPHQDRRLREIDFGALEGALWTDLDPAVDGQICAFRDFAAPGGESVDDLRGRVLAFLAELGSGSHLLFTHGGVIRVLTRDLGIDRFLPTGSVVVLDWPAQRVLRLCEPARQPAPADQEEDRVTPR